MLPPRWYKNDIPRPERRDLIAVPKLPRPAYNHVQFVLSVRLLRVYFVRRVQLYRHSAVLHHLRESLLRRQP